MKRFGAYFFVVFMLALLVALIVSSIFVLKQNPLNNDIAGVFSIGMAIGIVGGGVCIYFIICMIKADISKRLFKKMFGFSPIAQNKASTEEIKIEKSIVSDRIKQEIEKINKSRSKQQMDQFIKKIKNDPKTFALIEEYKRLKEPLKKEFLPLKNLWKILKQIEYEMPEELDQAMDQMKELVS